MSDFEKISMNANILKVQIVTLKLTEDHIYFVERMQP